MKTKYFQLLLCFIVATETAVAQDLTITVEGDATFSGSSYFITEAGEDFDSSIESESSVFVSVLSEDYWKKNNRNKKWRIFVHRSDLSWNSDLMLETKRTGTGYNPQNSGNPNISDGENFLNITSTPTYFFRGKDEIAYIPVSIKLSGLSLTMGAQQFETNIVLTIYDDW